MSKKKNKISKTAVLLANEQYSDQKSCYKQYLHTYLLCSRSRKNDNVN